MLNEVDTYFADESKYFWTSSKVPEIAISIFEDLGFTTSYILSCLFFNSNEIMTENPYISTPLVNAETNTEKRETRGRKPKFSSEEERRESILRSKRNYYHRNAELSRLKALRLYYDHKLTQNDLEEDKKERYERKLRELTQRIHIFVNSPAGWVPSPSSSSETSD